MNDSTSVNIYFSPIGSFDIVDAEREFLLANPLGLLTWRRANQLPPQGSTLVVTVELEDALGDRDVTASQALMSHSEGTMSLELARRIVAKFFGAVKDAKNQHEDSWLFIHSESYRRNAQLIATAEKLADEVDQPSR
jgi:hypothetical protein